MSSNWARVFPGQPRQVAEARHFVAAMLENEDEGLVADAVMVVSELASNAVQHTRSGRCRGWFVVVVGFSDDLIRVQVTDQGGDKEPEVRSVLSPAEEGGRGLMLVTAFAKNWGVEDMPDGGRCVWADLARVGL